MMLCRERRERPGTKPVRTQNWVMVTVVRWMMPNINGIEQRALIDPQPFLPSEKWQWGGRQAVARQ